MGDSDDVRRAISLLDGCARACERASSDNDAIDALIHIVDDLRPILDERCRGDLRQRLEALAANEAGVLSRR